MKIGLIGVIFLVISCAHRTKESFDLQMPPGDLPPEPSFLESSVEFKIHIKGIENTELLMESRSIEIEIENLDFEQSREWVLVRLNNQNIARFENNQFHLELTRDQFRAGSNLLQVIVMKPWGESVKAQGAYEMWEFFYKHRETSWLGRPLLTVLSPRADSYVEDESKEIDFDVVLWNVSLSQQGHRLRYRLNASDLRELSVWGEMKFVNLLAGRYLLDVHLVDAKGRNLPSPWENRVAFQVRP